MQEEQLLRLQHFHTHWYLQREGSPQLLIEPCPQFDQVSVTSALPKTSTQREPLAFENVEKASQVRTRARPTCSRRHTQSHTMSSNACPLRYAHLVPSSTSTAVGSKYAVTAGSNLVLSFVAAVSSAARGNLRRSAPGVLAKCSITAIFGK